MQKKKMLVITFFCTNFISVDNIKSWFAWGNWVSPMTYAQNALAINEFLDKRWNMVSLVFGKCISIIRV